MADASDSGLLGVVVGGLLTLIGGLIGTAATALTSWRRAKIDKAKLRAAKFEELVKSVYELDQWLATVVQIGAGKVSFEKLPPSPLSHMQAIGAVYFPILLDRINALVRTIRLYPWAEEDTVKESSIGDVGSGRQEAYIAARDALLQALIQYARKEFQ